MRNQNVNKIWKHLHRFLINPKVYKRQITLPFLQLHNMIFFFSKINHIKKLFHNTWTVTTVIQDPEEGTSTHVQNNNILSNTLYQFQTMFFINIIYKIPVLFTLVKQDEYMKDYVQALKIMCDYEVVLYIKKKKTSIKR